MIWGHLANNQLIINKTKQTGDKAVIFTEIAVESNEIAHFIWTEQGDNIVQVWEVEETNDEQLTPSPDSEAWDVSQGEFIPVGRIITVHGVMYECIKDHYAAWSKQPPNDEYWRTI